MPRRPKPATPAQRKLGLARVVDRLRESRERTASAPRRPRHRPAFYALLGSGILVFVVAVWPIVKAHLEAVAILQLVSGKPVPALLADFVANPTTTQDITLHVETGAVRARLYTPVRKPNGPALVVLHGVHHLGIDEPRLMAFASAMASCGIQVLTPQLDDIKDYHVGSSSVKTIGESAQWFAKRTGGPVGVMGLSFSGGLALIAAADPLYHPDIKFVLCRRQPGLHGPRRQLLPHRRRRAPQRHHGRAARARVWPTGPGVRVR